MFEDATSVFPFRQVKTSLIQGHGIAVQILDGVSSNVGYDADWFLRGTFRHASDALILG